LALGALIAATSTGCASTGGDGSSATTLTYWASNQGRSIQQDEQVLGPELKKFQEQTGIKVKLEVIGWSDLFDRILKVTTGGQGPDVVNIGNTWSASLQATGAFLPFAGNTMAKVGGEQRFVPTTLASTGAANTPPAFIPLYGLAYGLYYNKRLFAAAGISRPPASWQELVSDAKKLTDRNRKQYGLGIEGASYTQDAHFAWIFGTQNGARLFQGVRPGFDSPQMVAGVRQYLDLLTTDKVIDPIDAAVHEDADLLRQFATGKAAMMMVQNYATAGLAEDGMTADKFGVVPIPRPVPLPQGGREISSPVAGINIGVFKSSKNKDGALKLVDFLTSSDEQKILNYAFGSLPVVSQAYDDPRFQTPLIQTFRGILASSAMPLPMIPQEAQFETLMGETVKQLIADAAAGIPVTDQTIKTLLATANQKMQESQ
jgi:multiple sugar transport system substrate-binding protein